MENNHILTVERFKELARPTSKHIDNEEVLTFIRECEDIFIIPAIGLERFKRLDEYPILLAGGEYTDEDGILRKCPGLELTLSYYVYSRMIMADGGMLTRTGLMQHNDSYASRESDKSRVRMYNEVMEVAETYMGMCLRYLKTISKKGVKPLRGTRLQIYSIGD